MAGNGATTSAERRRWGGRDKTGRRLRSVAEKRSVKVLQGPNLTKSTEEQATSPKVEPFGPQRAGVSLTGTWGISGVSNARAWKIPGRSGPWCQGGGLWGEMRI